MCQQSSEICVWSLSSVSAGISRETETAFELQMQDQGEFRSSVTLFFQKLGGMERRLQAQKTQKRVQTQIWTKLQELWTQDENFAFQIAPIFLRCTLIDEEIRNVWTLTIDFKSKNLFCFTQIFHLKPFLELPLMRSMDARLLPAISKSSIFRKMRMNYADEYKVYKQGSFWVLFKSKFY